MVENLRQESAADPPPLNGSTLSYGLTMEEATMSNKRHKPEEIVTKLRQVEVLRGQGMAMAADARSAAMDRMDAVL